MESSDLVGTNEFIRVWSTAGDPAGLISYVDSITRIVLICLNS